MSSATRRAHLLLLHKSDGVYRGAAAESDRGCIYYLFIHAVTMMMMRERPLMYAAVLKSSRALLLYARELIRFVCKFSWAMNEKHHSLVYKAHCLLICFAC